ncbi:hypothetical protein Pint_13177 [Pistacia integerrima]|uniref:Uncharacterized protein n=1 Tax=Pistacia integerrima TaxID=434235 RepID=A0ACC0YAT8_9ROSI|nr:hypothetical protein Pint_13177 [Pistacia integerrima]
MNSCCAVGSHAIQFSKDPAKCHYYRLLPDSEKKNEESLHEEASQVKSRKQKPIRQCDPVNRKDRFNRYALSAAILASTNSILLGYDIGVMSGAVLYIRDNLKITSIQVEILVGSLNVCSLIGSLAAGKTSDCIGRRYTIVLAAATFLMGALLMGFAPSFSFLMAGRLVAGHRSWLLPHDSSGLHSRDLSFHRSRLPLFPPRSLH